MPQLVSQPGAMVYTQAFGSRPENVEVPHIDVRAPSAQDKNYPVGKRWIDTVAGNEYSLTSFTSFNGVSTANWAFLGSSAGDLNSLTTDDLTVVTPTAGTIIFTGNATQGVSTSGTNAPGTVTVTVADWTTTQKGVGVLATNAQGIAGSGTTQAMTPASTQAKLGTQTAHGVAMGNTGSTSAVSWSAAGTSGQPFISGGAAADGAYGTLGVAGGGTGAVTLTSHGVLLGNGTGAVAALAEAATGTVLAGVTGANPAFTGSPSVSGSLTAATTVTATLGAITATNGNLVLGTAGNKILSTSVATTTTAGANSFGTVTLVGGTATVSTTAITTNSIVFLTRQTIGATGAAALGMISRGTISNGVSFVINALSSADATALAATDVSNIGWMIVN